MSRFFSLWTRYGPQSIENTGSQARDHLANERTFLAWTRTGVGFAAMGLALGRLDLIDRLLPPKPEPAEGPGARARKRLSEHAENFKLFGRQVSAPSSATVCQSISAWCLVYGLVRYLAGANRLLQGQFLPAKYGPIALSTGCILLFGAVLVQHDIQKTTADERKQDA